MKVALIQSKVSADRAGNLRRAAASVRAARAAGAELAVFSELHTARYFCQVEDPAAFDGAEPIPGPYTQALSELARTNGMVLVGSLFEHCAPGLAYNTAVVFERDGKLAGRYRKMHIPDDPGYYEKFYFAPGDLGFTPIDTSAGRLGVLVCWDQWYPEAARLMTLAGAEILIYPTAIGWDPRDAAGEKIRQREAWTTIQRAHAVANGVPVLSVNRVGREPDPAGGAGIAFWGHSFAAGCQGELLAEAGDKAEALLIVELERGRTESVRRIWPFLRDRRVDAYAGLTQRYGPPPRTKPHHECTNHSSPLPHSRTPALLPPSTLHPPPSTSHLSPSRKRRGIALLAALLLTTLVGTVALAAVTHAGVNLRWGRAMRTQTELRATLRAVVSGTLSVSNATLTGTSRLSPGGTTVTLQAARVDVAVLPAALRPDTPSGGNMALWRIKAQAQRESSSAALQAIVQRPRQGGAARVLAWVER